MLAVMLDFYVAESALIYGTGVIQKPILDLEFKKHLGSMFKSWSKTYIETGRITGFTLMRVYAHKWLNYFETMCLLIWWSSCSNEKLL